MKGGSSSNACDFVKDLRVLLDEAALLGQTPPVEIPEIDISALRGDADASPVSSEIRRACRESGFFYVVGHGVDDELGNEVDRLAREFFARPLEEKLRIRMELGGRAWRVSFR
jgi:isopenicillin N synthase-like dioxygenase